MVLKMNIIRWIKSKHPHRWIRSRSISRIRKNEKDRHNLIAKNMTIFSSNCIGGIIYHELGEKFLSPTINLWIKPSDYIEMLSDPKKYFVPQKMKKAIQNKHKYPVGEIEGKRIYGVHYNSYEELNKKWNSRCTRINWNNIYVFMIERDGCSYQDLKEFDKLPYKNKIVFTKYQYPDIQSSFVIPGSFDEKNNNVNDLCGYKNFFSGLRTIDKFDYVSFLNSGKRKLTKGIKE